jgi:hypothetical protein
MAFFPLDWIASLFAADLRRNPGLWIDAPKLAMYLALEKNKIQFGFLLAVGLVRGGGSHGCGLLARLHV